MASYTELLFQVTKDLIWRVQHGVVATRVMYKKKIQ